MLRATRPLLTASARGLSRPVTPIGTAATSQTQRHASAATWRPRVPATASSSRQLVPLIQRARFAAKNEPDVKFERDVANKKLEKDPEHVTSESSVRQFEGPGEKLAEASASEGLKGDLNRLAEAVALRSVPPMSYRLGLAGTIPYFATSLATVYCSWDMNTDWPSQSQFLNHIMISHEQAAYYLHLLEPLQVGYGAVIISFLGAIHWGLEYAEKTPNAARTKFRYGLGVIAPAIAWPTVMLPVQFALTAQFAAFTLMYFADTRATTRGWAPQWYGTYRFVLTFIVGSALLISLIGREKVGPDRPRLTGLREKFHKEGPDVMAQHEWEKKEAEEKERIHKQKAEEEKMKKKEEEKEENAKKEGASKKPKGGDKKPKRDDGKAGKDDGKDESEGDAKDEGKHESTEGSEGEDDKDEGKDESKDAGKDEDKEDSKEEGGNDSNKGGDKPEAKKDGKGGDEKKKGGKSK